KSSGEKGDDSINKNFELNAGFGQKKCPSQIAKSTYYLYNGILEPISGGQAKTCIFYCRLVVRIKIVLPIDIQHSKLGIELKKQSTWKFISGKNISAGIKRPEIKCICTA